ncbi:MAG: NAD(P)H-dependent oxidoreductase [Donghicola eburneus]|nr:NAD(P)H-dependent oxidoreductase [Donghicola eburneus]MCI5041693.1 NAD(P)H-dependent oxidoreductase [Donghicola eburneus]
MTKTVLRIDSSVRKDESVTRDLTNRIVARLNADEVITRDLIETPPLVDEAWATANFTPADKRTDAQKEILALSDTIIDELRAADTIVIGLPIYNFMIPASLKAWVDQFIRAGVTFRYTEAGPEGLLPNKRAILAVASGGTGVGSQIDHATTYMKFILGFVGITDVTIVAADQLAIDAEGSVKNAYSAVEQIAA